MVQTESHEKFSKIKVVDLVEIYNFYVHDFSSDIIWCLKILFELFIFWNSNFELYKQSHEKFSKIKVEGLDEFYNFYVYNILILDHLMH